MSAALVVIGEVSLLQIALRKTYSSLNNYHIYNQRLQPSKQTKIVLNSSETEEDEDNFVDDLGAGSSSIANQSSAPSINSVYVGLKRLKDKLSKNLNVLTDISYLYPFCEVIKNIDKELCKKYLYQYKEQILKHKNFLEVYTPNGKPFKTLFYYTDDSMLWSSIYLDLVKETKIE